MLSVNTVGPQKFKFCFELVQVVAHGDITIVVVM
jgi:hypothetical protein